jgi:hypothetical protein
MQNATRCNLITFRNNSCYPLISNFGIIINTAASARWKEVLALHELFQQFAPGEKPLKRLVGRCLPCHRAKAAVLMKARVLCD